MRYDPRSDRVKRGAALARPELRQREDYVKVESRLPDRDRACTVWATDGGVPYRVPFPVRFDEEGKWRNVRHGNMLDVKIVGWIYQP